VDALAHGNACQCECLDDAGDPASAGALTCNLGVDIDVESAAPCGDGDLLFRIGQRCIPFTTEASSGIVLDANHVPGEELPPGGNQGFGIPLPCDTLAANGPAGLSIASGVNAFDVELAGDIAFLFVLTCR
jgi:hypothetical protein